MDGFLALFLHQFQNLKIQLEEIILATNNFDTNNRIGVGGFGPVYRGEVSHSKGRSMVAIKRHDPKGGQGIPEFLKELTMLSRYSHENLISLLGFCCEGCEMILVYELAARGSLDRHLNSPHLTWSQRLKICVDAAKGLSYLHDPRETHQRIIHCDVKSANILLNDEWDAKVSDFGLSIMGSANEQQSVIVTLAAGTPGYIDPMYRMTNTLTKESDVYSFGVVLFEVLCGKLSCIYRNRCVEKSFVPTWIESYKQKKLNDIIYKNAMVQPLDQSALETISGIAYRCLNMSREDRPKMAEVVIELETALKTQVFLNSLELKIINMNYRSNGELMQLLSKGVLLNDGKTWLSLNEKGEHCEMISFASCVLENFYEREFHNEYNNSIFVVGSYYMKQSYSHHAMCKIHVETQFLSPGITYTVNLVFKFMLPMDNTKKGHNAIYLRYRLEGKGVDHNTSFLYFAFERKDGLWMCELCQFTSDNRCVDFDILFSWTGGGNGFIEAEGIEFLPLEKVEHKEEKQPISDLDGNWEDKLPTDYEKIMERSTNSMRWTTKKEAYSLICQGLLIDDGKKWFSLDENGKKCHMVSARFLSYGYNDCRKIMASPESRFGEVLQFHGTEYYYVHTNINSQLVSSQTTYASYLVYKLPKDQSGLEGPFTITDNLNRERLGHNKWYIYLTSPQTPLLRPKANQNTHNLANRLNIKGIALPRHRNDGWMEVQIWEFHTATNTEKIKMTLRLCAPELFTGLIVQGVEFRPI